MVDISQVIKGKTGLHIKLDIPHVSRMNIRHP